MKSLFICCILVNFRYLTLPVDLHLPLEKSVKTGSEDHWILAPYVATTQKKSVVLMSCRVKGLDGVNNIWLSKENSTLPLEEDPGHLGIQKVNETMPDGSSISKYKFTFNELGTTAYTCFAQVGSELYKSTQKIRIRVRGVHSYNPIGTCIKYSDFGSHCSREFSGKENLVYVNETSDTGHNTESFVNQIIAQLSEMTLSKRCRIFMKPFVCSTVYRQCHVSESTYYATYTELCPTEFMHLKDECIQEYKKSPVFNEIVSKNEERYNLLMKIEYKDCFYMGSNQIKQISLQPYSVSTSEDVAVNLTCSVDASEIPASSIKKIVWTRDMNIMSEQNISRNTDLNSQAKLDVTLEYSVRRYQCSIEFSDGQFISSNPVLLRRTSIPYKDNGFCVKYSDFGSVCSTVIESSRIVYTKTLEDMARVESDINNMLRFFQPTLPMNCKMSFLAVTCNLAYPKCKPYMQQSKSGLDLVGVCREEYLQHMATCGSHYRRNEKFENIQNIPEYNEKTDNQDNCLHFPTRQYSLSTNCKHSDGVGYRGKLNVTASGRPCYHWSETKFKNLVKFHESQNTDAAILDYAHNYCRNPLLDGITSFMEGPYCIVGKGEFDDYEYELCDIPECGHPAALYAVSGSSSLFFLILLLVFLFLLLVPTYRRKYLPKLDKMHSSRFLRRHGVMVTIPLDECSSLNHSKKQMTGKRKPSDDSTPLVSTDRGDSDSEFSEIPQDDGKNTYNRPKPTYYTADSFSDDSNEECKESIDNVKIDKLIQSFLSVQNYSDEQERVTTEEAFRSVPIFYSSEFQQMRNSGLSSFEPAIKHKSQFGTKHLPELKVESPFNSITGDQHFSMKANVHQGFLKVAGHKSSKRQFAVVRRMVETPGELAFRYSLKHENVLAILGIMVEEKDQFIGCFDVVFEYSLSDDVLSFIRHGCHFDWPKCSLDFLQIALQVASGLTFLETNTFVHGDISLRNCKVFPSSDRDGIPVVKISDFSKFIPEYHSEYTIIPSCSCKFMTGVCIEQIYLPIRWISPETLCYFFSKSKAGAPELKLDDVENLENIEPPMQDSTVNGSLSAEYLKSYCVMLESDSEHHTSNPCKPDAANYSFPSNLSQDPSHVIWYTLSRVPGSRASDVWSYGILLYELYHRNLPSAHIPIETYISEIIAEPDSAGVLPRNRQIVYGFQLPIEMKQIIKRCVKKNPKNRPSFSEIYSYLRKIAEKKEIGIFPIKESNKESSPISHL